MKEYFKIASLNNTTIDYSNTIVVTVDDSEQNYVEKSNGKFITNIYVKDNTASELVNCAQTIAEGIKKFDGCNLDFDPSINTQFLIENIILALTDVNVYKKDYQVACEHNVNFDTSLDKHYVSAHKKAQAYHLTRMINHLPFEVCNSDSISENICALLDDDRFTVEVMRLDECRKLQMNGVLALARGAKREPAVIKITYNTDPTKKKIGLVGKGIMFDSGGYNIKSGDFGTMKTDMAGSGAVIGSLKRLANLNVEANVVAYLMTAENLINEHAYLPGDVITYSNGISVEIGNTDAEGRLVLADGLLLTQHENCDTVIDIATLTGNSATALGKGFAPLYSTCDSVTNTFTSLNYNSTDNIWPMPLPQEYNEFLKGNISDIRNVSSSKHAGSITAALFLQHFAPDNANWVHIDMGAMSRKPEFGTPVNGYGARLLSDFIISYTN